MPLGRLVIRRAAAAFTALAAAGVVTIATGATPASATTDPHPTNIVLSSSSPAPDDAAATSGTVTPMLTGCGYPSVCLYNSGKVVTGAFKDVTTYFQTLGASRGAYWAKNTRHDDVVYLHYTNGQVGCISPNTDNVYLRNIGIVDGIEIRPESVCFQPGPV